MRKAENRKRCVKIVRNSFKNVLKALAGFSCEEVLFIGLIHPWHEITVPA
jgi:hypothetical protein